MRYRHHPARRRPEAPSGGDVSPAAGRFVLVEPSYDRQVNPLPRGLSPRDVERILSAANYGDTADLCKLAAELEDRNWDIQHNMSTRRNALAGCEWTVEPGDDTPQAREIAEAFEDCLRNTGEADDLDTFEDLLRNLMGAVIAPFAVSEIVWLPGGGIEGFKAVESRHFTLRDSEWPRLVTVEEPSGMELPPYKFIVQRFRRGGDICKGGLIRTLAWLHVLQNFPIKDWSAYTERFGMPFIVARLDQNAWEQEREVHKAMIRNFGPSGGGVFTKAAEIQLLQAAAGGENTYKLLVDYMGDAITKVLLGQLASSSEASGLSGGDAQSEVRQDILSADARAVESAVRAQVAAPWTLFRWGSAAAVPRLKINAEPPEDAKADAEVKQLRANAISLMAAAGWEPESPEELKEILGIAWRRKPVETSNPYSYNSTSEGADIPKVDADTLNLKQKYDAMGVAIRAGLLTATPEIEAQTRAELNLPSMTPEVQKAWEATGGIRQPITLKSAEAEAVSQALDVDDKAFSGEDRFDRSSAICAALDAGILTKTNDVIYVLSRLLDVDTMAFKAESDGDPLKSWLGPLAKEIDELAAGESDNRSEFVRRIERICAAPPGDDSAVAAEVEREMLRGLETGRAAARKILKKNKSEDKDGEKK